MAEVDFKVDTAAWQKQLAQLSAATSKGMEEVLNEEFPLLVRKIVDFTPPKTLAQGRTAVASDIAKTMKPFDPAAIRTEGMREIVARKDYDAYNIVAARVKSGPMKGTRAIPFSGDRHTTSRNARGRVTRTYGDRVLGREDSALLRRYVKAVQDRVGWAKAGWLRALHLVGGTAPAFVERHSPGSGDVIDRRKDQDNPSLTAINRTPWAIRKDEGQRIIQDAYYSRANAIFSKVKTKLRLAAKEAGFDTAA